VRDMGRRNGVSMESPVAERRMGATTPLWITQINA